MVATDRQIPVISYLPSGFDKAEQKEEIKKGGALARLFFLSYLMVKFLRTLGWLSSCNSGVL